MKLIKSIKEYLKRSDKILWFIMLSISTYCLVLLFSVSRAGKDFFYTQLLAIVIGYIGAILLTLVDYRGIANLWYVVAIVGVLLIVYTLIFGISVEGSAGVNAKAWIKLPGGITFQPSELVKIFFIITFSKHLSIIKEKGTINSFKSVMLLAIHALIPVGLTHLQGDDGAAIIFFFMFLSMSFAAGIQYRYFITLFGIILSAIPFVWNYILAPYQKNRLINQINPESDPLGAGYQQIQSQISIGSGQIMGRGIFKGPRVGHSIVPVQESDFIFSVAGEELGFIGCILLIAMIMILLIKIFFIAKNSCDDLGYIMSYGFFGLIASQTIFNLGMCLFVLPVMGVTLPFFSAGGSSSSCLYLGIGLLENIYMNRYDTDKVSGVLDRVIVKRD